MSRVVDGETKTDDEENGDDTVHGQVPVVHQAEQEDIDEHDGQDDEYGHGDTTSD